MTNREFLSSIKKLRPYPLSHEEKVRQAGQGLPTAKARREALKLLEGAIADAAVAALTEGKDAPLSPEVRLQEWELRKDLARAGRKVSRFAQDYLAAVERYARYLRRLTKKREIGLLGQRIYIFDSCFLRSLQKRMESCRKEVAQLEEECRKLDSLLPGMAPKKGKRGRRERARLNKAIEGLLELYRQAGVTRQKREEYTTDLLNAVGAWRGTASGLRFKVFLLNKTTR